MTPDMYRVEWVDSGMHKDLGWAKASEYLDGLSLDNMTVVTVGMIMHEGEDIIVLGLNYDPYNETWIAAQLIARDNIISVERLSAVHSPEGVTA